MLVEALACGRPVVATPVGGIPEVVDAASGLLVTPRDADALADALAKALAQDWDEAALARRTRAFGARCVCGRLGLTILTKDRGSDTCAESRVSWGRMWSPPRHGPGWSG